MRPIKPYLKILYMIALFVWISSEFSLSDTIEHSHAPERVILNITSTPYNSMAVTWRSQTRGNYPRAEIINTSSFSKRGAAATTFKARTSAVKTGDIGTLYHHSVKFTGLEPDTLYSYRVGNDDGFNEWSQFSTAKSNPSPFVFLYFGDIQQEIYPFCSQVLRAAFQTDSNAAFWLFTGDMVDSGHNDSEWGAFFKSLGWISQMIPIVPVPGNHEYPSKRSKPSETLQISKWWRPHFTLPDNGPMGLEETSYYFNYQGTCFIVVNGNQRIEKQAEWLKKTLENNKQKWVIIAMHPPVYSISKNRNRVDLKNHLIPVFDRFSVDLVLQGHDHAYSRTFPLKNHKRVIGKEKGTVYLISNAGPKFYKNESKHEHLMAKTGRYQPFFQSVSVSRKKLTIIVYTLEKKVFDIFEINK